MKRPPVILMYGLLGLLLFAGDAAAGKRGTADLFLRAARTQRTDATVKVGDIVTVQAYTEGRGAAFTQADLVISFDDQYLELIPVNQGGGIIRPFSRGGYLGGQVQVNDTGGDVLGDSNRNQIPLFQMYYSELIPRVQGAPQRTATGNGIIATAQLRVIRKPPSGQTVVRVDVISPSGNETGYFIPSDPGSIYNFRQNNSLTLTIQGVRLSGRIPDLYMLPGEVNATLDLDDFLDDPGNPDSTITWTASLARPDSVQVTVDPVTHVVTVDPRVNSGGFATNFIGIARVTYTAATQAAETVQDSHRVIVDTPPRFLDTIPDTVQFEEDGQDTTLVLAATDPDPGTVLTFSVLEPDTAVNSTVFIDQVTGKVTFGARRDYSGSEVRRFRVADQFQAADTLAVQVIVTPVNDPPRFTKPFPVVTIGMLGQETLNLPDFAEDVDDPFDRLRFTFSGVDSIAFEVSAGNQQMKITSVPPFTGTREALVVVADTSLATATQLLTVKVNPPSDPQPPRVQATSLKVGVRAGSNPTTVTLDDKVEDLDTPKGQLRWTMPPVTLVQVDQNALSSSRQLRVSAAPDSVGFRASTLTVTDPTALSDSLAVRIYSSSIATGVPETGGLPDLFLFAGTADTLDLDGFYFDANNTDAEMTWTASGQQDVTVTIGANPPHQAIVRAPQSTANAFEDVVFTVADPDGNAGSDTMRVNILAAGTILLDLSRVGNQRTMAQGQRDTIDLTQALVAGDASKILWSARSNNNNVAVSTSSLNSSELVLLGVQEGNASITVTATDTSTLANASDDISVTVTPAGGNGGDGGSGPTLRLIESFPLTLTAEQDTTIDLAGLIVAGASPNLLWTSDGNPNVGVEVDQADQTAILRPRAGFVGNAGAILFRARNAVNSEEASTRADPVSVVPGQTVIRRGLLKISVVANPVLPNFLDVFVISQRRLLSDPFLRVRVVSGGEAAAAVKPRTIAVDSVEQVSDVWVGDLSLSDNVTGQVELSATGIATDTRIALTDTLLLEVREARIQSSFRISDRAVTVSLPARALNKPSVVALIPDRGGPGEAAATPASLLPASGIYRVYAPYAEVIRPGEIRFRFAGRDPERTGVYRWDAATGRWLFAGALQADGEIAGEFSGFGRYGLFVDSTAPAPGEPEALDGGRGLKVPVAEDGSGVDPASVALWLNGERVEAYFDAGAGGVIWAPPEAFGPGLQVLRMELADLAGNTAVWERRLDLGALMPGPAAFVLHQNYPNPFNPQTVIRFELPEVSAVRLAVYNMLGQLVRTLLAETRGPGRYEVAWDARDSRGRTVGAGAYFYRLETPEAVLTKKMMLLK